MRGRVVGSGLLGANGLLGLDCWVRGWVEEWYDARRVIRTAFERQVNEGSRMMRRALRVH